MGARTDLTDPGPPRLHDEEQLRASVERELKALLNTRAPLSIDVLERRARSAIDYGIPDLSAFPMGEHDAMSRLARHVRDAIAVYEPRLIDPMVEIGRTVQSAQTLSVIVRGALETGTMRRMPVTFELVQGDFEADGDAA